MEWFRASALPGSAVSTAADYARFGLSGDTPEPGEDGARTDNSPGTYAWWYFDAHLDDGSKLVVVFLNKDITRPQAGLEPMVRISLDLPDGRRFDRVATFPAGDYHAASDGCDVQIGENRFSGDLHTYRITASVDEITVDVTLVGDLAPWRPGTGHMLFGRDRAREFAWLPAVPQGHAEVQYRVGDQAQTTTGVGYHDHNWGNVPLPQVVHHWYWARGQAGPYSVIASFITSHRRYGYSEVPVFMLARNGRVIADDASRVRFETEQPYRDDATGKPVFAVTRYIYEVDLDRYVVTFTRQRDLASELMIDSVQGLARLAAKAAGFDGAYLRFAGELRVEQYRRGELVHEFRNEAIWELMYFGRARRP